MNKEIKFFKLIIALILLLSINSLFASEADVNEPSLRTVPVLEVSGDQMPGWEKQIIERYHDENGDPIPVIFKGAAKDWEAAGWTPEFFVENFGDTQVTVVGQNVLEDRTYDLATTIKDHINDIQLNSINAGYMLASIEHNATKESIATIEDDGFLNNLLFIYNCLNLETQTGFPQSKIVTNADKRQYFLFIGSENTVASLHSHGSTFLSQMYGKKIARLVHPKYTKKCNCESYFNINDTDTIFNDCITLSEANFESPSKYIETCCCPLDEPFAYSHRCATNIAKPDFNKYPELKDIEVHETILEPGDVLYIPDHWLHDIRSRSTSISIASGF